MYTSTAVIDYITEGPSVLVSFVGNQRIDLWSRLQELKGKKIDPKNR